jgi:hypothetical protein
MEQPRLQGNKYFKIWNKSRIWGTKRYSTEQIAATKEGTKKNSSVEQISTSKGTKISATEEIKITMNKKKFRVQIVTTKKDQIIIIRRTNHDHRRTKNLRCGTNQEYIGNKKLVRRTNLNNKRRNKKLPLWNKYQL